MLRDLGEMGKTQLGESRQPDKVFREQGKATLVAVQSQQMITNYSLCKQFSMWKVYIMLCCN